MHNSHYLNGVWVKGEGPSFISENPADGKIIWQGTHATALEIDQAVAAARLSQPKWEALGLNERGRYIEAFKETLKSKQQMLKEIISKETGKPLWEAQTEVDAMIGKIDISMQAQLERASFSERKMKNLRSVTRHKPHGVAAIFGPFNFPGHLPNGHIVPALLAGNTVILKPSEKTPLVAETMVALWESAHLPKGVLGLIQGGAETGSKLACQDDLDALFFTGSWKIGQLLAEHFVEHPEKILALELGGNNPLVIGDLKDPIAAAYLTIQSAYLTAGQRCTCARRLIVVENKQSTKFLMHLQAMIDKIRIGPASLSPEPFMGPLIDNEAADAILQTQEELGGKIIKPCRRLQKDRPFLSPGLIDTTDCNLEDREIFGPLLQLIYVNSFQEAVQAANDTSFGLAAGLLSDAKSEWRIFYDTIKSGIINCNTQLTGASSNAPFGGIGRSGNHRPSAFYAADYCSYPVASLEADTPTIPKIPTPGISYEL